MFDKFIRGLKVMFGKEPEYEIIPYSEYNNHRRRHAPTYHSNYYGISKYIDNDGYIVACGKKGLLKDIQDCNTMLLYMDS